MKKLVLAILISALLGVPELAHSAQSFTDNGDGTVTDNVTGLMWQKCSAGLSGAGCATGTAGTYTWSQALTYCGPGGLNLGGKTDWRLPNVKELKSIVDYTKYSPAIDGNYFPGTLVNWYWSSTTIAGYTTTDAWGVGSLYGTVEHWSKTYFHYVRCVRP